ncbi:hypothetical protein VUS46_36020, partial [Pseudomonas aeruginosa]
NGLTREWIDGFEGLVENENGRIGDNGTGQINLLGHTRGVVTHQEVGGACQAEGVKESLCAFVDGGLDKSV